MRFSPSLVGWIFLSRFYVQLVSLLSKLNFKAINYVPLIREILHTIMYIFFNYNTCSIIMLQSLTLTASQGSRCRKQDCRKTEKGHGRSVAACADFSKARRKTNKMAAHRVLRPCHVRGRYHAIRRDPQQVRLSSMHHWISM